MNRTTQRWLLTGGAFIAAGLGLAAHDAATNHAHAHDRKPAATEQADERRPVRALLEAVGDTLPVKVELPTPAAPTAEPEPTVEPTTPPAPEPEPEPTREPESTTPPAPDPEPEPTRPDPPNSPPDPPNSGGSEEEPSPEPSEPARGGDSTPSPEPTPTAPLCDVPLVDGVCQILDDVTDVIPPVVVDVPPVVIDVPPIVIDVPPVVVDVPPITVTLPATEPSTLPGADAQPAPVTAPAAVVPALPVTVGPTVVETLDEPEPTLIEIAYEAVDAADPEPDCWQPPGRDRADKRIHDGLNPPPRKKIKRGKGGCPGTPGAPDRTEATPTSGSHGSGQQTPADLASALTPPALDRLDHARARSHLPASRHTCIEPAPA